MLQITGYFPFNNCQLTMNDQKESAIDYIKRVESKWNKNWHGQKIGKYAIEDSPLKTVSIDAVKIGKYHVSKRLVYGEQMVYIYYDEKVDGVEQYRYFSGTSAPYETRLFADCGFNYFTYLIAVFLNQTNDETQLLDLLNLAACNKLYNIRNEKHAEELRNNMRKYFDL